MQAKQSFRSNIMLGGDIIHPEMLEVGEETLTYEKHYRFCHKKHTVTIYLTNIIAFEMQSTLRGVILTIKTKERSISCRGLSKKKANRIKKLIENS